MPKKRFDTVIYILIFLFMTLAARIFYYQIVQGQSLTALASSQRMLYSSIEKPRGRIVDRNGISFTDRSVKNTIVLKPASLRGKHDDIKEICGILNISLAEISSKVENSNEPLIFDATATQARMALQIDSPGISVINSLSRYDENTLARHVLGYINKADQVGQAGIEKYLNDALKYSGADLIGIVTDARKNPLEGLGYRLVRQSDSDSALTVKLTLDFHIQQIVEDCMERNGIIGAVVVEDIASGDIVAMCSKPDYNQNDVGQYLSSPNNELFNRATASYNLGSIFKIIDAALLLESDIDPSQEYFCEGFIKVGGRELKCSSYKNGGHGYVDLRKAFAQSCNSYFINMGLKIGYKNIINRAKDFGLGEAVGLGAQGIKESAGHLPAADAFYSSGDIANISIGQGEIMATPVQVADIVATVANGGIKNKINIADSVTDQYGNKVRDLRTNSGRRIIEKEIADKLKSLMEEVTLSGTGKRAYLSDYGGAAGKTGSAQTGNDAVVHAWFGGYFPLKTPRYAIAVFVENGQLGGEAAAPIFAEIAQEIARKGY